MPSPSGSTAVHEPVTVSNVPTAASSLAVNRQSGITGGSLRSETAISTDMSASSPALSVIRTS